MGFRYGLGVVVGGGEKVKWCGRGMWVEVELGGRGGLSGVIELVFGVELLGAAGCC